MKNSHFGLALQGNLERLTNAEADALAEAITNAMIGAGDKGKNNLRVQTREAFNSPSMPTTWRGQIYPKKGVSLNPAYLVYSLAPKIMESVVAAQEIRAASGPFLAVPNPFTLSDAKHAGEKVTPENWPESVLGELFFTKTENGQPALASVPRGGTFTIWFILLPSVQTKKKIDMKTAANLMAGSFVSEFARYSRANEGRTQELYEKSQ